MKKTQGKNTKVRNAVSLEWKGLTFKSKLELFTYQKLLEAGIKDFKYEEEKFQLLEPFEFNGESIEGYDRSVDGIKRKYYEIVSNSVRGITYLPDFTCFDENKTGWILECKGYPNDAFPLKWKMFKDYLVKNGYNITLYKPSNQQTVLKTIELIKQKFYGEKLQIKS